MNGVTDIKCRDLSGNGFYILSLHLWVFLGGSASHPSILSKYSTLNLYLVWLSGLIVISLILGPHNKFLSLEYTSLGKPNLTSYSRRNSEHIFFLKYSESYQECFCIFFMPKYNSRTDILKSLMSSFLFSSAYHLTDEL